jgi:dienelactone hydrolase
MKRNNRHTVILILIFLSIYLISCQTENEKRGLLFYSTAGGKTKKIRDASDWQNRYEQILDSMQVVMGPLPDSSKKVPLEIQILGDTIIGDVRRIKLSYASEFNDRVPAFLIMPVKITEPLPGILCLHQTTEIGKGEPAGLGGNPDLFYAYELAKRGYVTLAPDYPNFGDYRYDPYTNGYKSATMKGIWNHMAAIDLLQSLPEVDPHRLGCIGHSLGGHNTLFLAAYDKRIKAVVTSCGFTSFFKYYGGDLTGWSHKGYMPRIASVYNSDPSLMPFDFPEIIAAIAPRAIFINAPLHDSNFDVSGVDDCVNEALQVYKLFNAENKIILKNPDAPHTFPPSVREESYKFFDREFSIDMNK